METTSGIARRAWHLAEEGALDAAIVEYERALAVADERTDLWEIHGELGMVLAKARQFDRAIAHHRLAADAALQQGEDPYSHAVQVERYFTAVLLLEMGRPMDALEEIAEAVSSQLAQGYVLTAQAQALSALGDYDRARSAAVRALERAQSDKQRERIREQLRDILQRG